jgi:geranylgeranyl pyrophosphate synthase
VLAVYKLQGRRTLQQRTAESAALGSGALPCNGELEHLLSLKHGSVPEGTWQTVLLQPIQDLTTRASKGFRGRLVSLAYRLTSGATRLSPTVRRRCELLGAVAELIHAGSLIVDDIQDGSSMRRGAPALHIRYGIPPALNAGNWLYFWPFELIRRAGLTKTAQLHAYERCQRMLLRAHFGQALDVGANIETLEQAEVPGVCLAAMELKSGALMGFALALGGLLARVPERGLNALDEFGHDLGVALQMFDDLGNVQGKREPAKQYEDLLLRRPSWVWACAAQEYPPQDYRGFSEAVAQLPRREPLERWFARTGLIESCRRRALDHMNATFETLAERLEQEGISWSHEVYRELRALGGSIAEAYV